MARDGEKFWEELNENIILMSDEREFFNVDINIIYQRGINPILESLSKTFKNKATLVETGTFLGNTSIFASKLFKTVRTIELSQKIYEKAKENFKDIENIEAYLGESPVILSQIIDKSEEDIIYFLDAHYSGPGTARAKSDTPLLSELEIIKTKSLNNTPVIVIDDFEIFDPRWAILERMSATAGHWQTLGDYPSHYEVVSALLKIDPQYVFYMFLSRDRLGHKMKKAKFVAVPKDLKVFQEFFIQRAKMRCVNLRFQPVDSIWSKKSRKPIVASSDHNVILVAKPDLPDVPLRYMKLDIPQHPANENKKGA